MATHSSVLAWRIPETGKPGGLSSLGSHRVGHDWSDLAAAAAENGVIYNFNLFKVIEACFMPSIWSIMVNKPGLLEKKKNNSLSVLVAHQRRKCPWSYWSVGKFCMNTSQDSLQLTFFYGFLPSTWMPRRRTESLDYCTVLNYFPPAEQWR